MAQLSTDTLVYSQIIARVQEFIEDYILKKTASPKTFNEEYQKLLGEIQNKIGGLSFDITPLYKGDIPNSEIFNKIIAMMSKDLNIMTNQLESMSANYINAYNLFANQIEAEKNAMTRIRSKINVLEMYSQSPSTDITYFGDSFNNLSFVDAKKIRAGLVPDVSDGYATLAKVTTKRVEGSIKVVNENYNEDISTQVSFAGPSNGLKGNHFLFNKNAKENKFLYENDSSILRSTESAITDSSPATYFEYEAISVLANGTTNRPSYEFQYFDGNKLINWANFDTSKPLKLTLEFSTRNRSGDNINYISVIPFFGYDIDGLNALISNIKVTSIKLLDEAKNTTYELINSGPVYIGSDPGQKNLSNYKRFFYNKGVFRFQERKVSKIYITFEQDQFKETTIKHTYWTPYEQGKNTKWYNQSRFEPEAVLGSTAQNVSWDKLKLVPNISRPHEFKSSPEDLRQVVVNYTSQVADSTEHSVVITSGKDAYYWYQKDPDTNIDMFTTKQDSVSYKDLQYMQTTRQRLINTDYPSACVLVDPSKRDEIKNKKISMSSISINSGIATLITSANHNLSLGDKVYIRDRWNTIDILGIFTITAIDSPTQVKFSVSGTSSLALTNISQNFGLCIKVIEAPTEVNTTISSYKKTINKAEKVFINLQKNFEELKAKRASIGIRDITFGRETFQESAEIISKPFFVPGNLEMLSLYAADYVPEGSTSRAYIRYSISVDGGTTFHPIQPVERNYTGTPEILAFNQNLSDDVTVPQIAYLNNGKQVGIPNPINSVIVKIEMRRDAVASNTPIVYYYKVGTRYR